MKGLALPGQALHSVGGANRDRTGDLYNAIVALSQLSYGPVAMPPLAPARAEAKEPGRAIQAKKTVFAAASGLVLVDLLDHLRHVAVVLAELGSVLDQVLLILLTALDHQVGVLDLGIGLDQVDLRLALARRLGLHLLRDDGAAAPRLQRRLRIMHRAAFRADDRIALQIV